MAVFRKHYFMDRWTIVSDQWAKRPYHFTDEPAEHANECPFCPGNQAISERILARSGKGENEIQVLQNKFPVFHSHPAGNHLPSPFLQEKAPKGYEEVVVETPVHNRDLGDQTPEYIQSLLQVFADRARIMWEDPEIQQIVIFRNRGQEAGASIEHPHSQVRSCNVVPYWNLQESEQVQQYRASSGKCPHCEVAAVEASSERVIEETEDWVSFAAFAPEWPMEVFIMPKRHVSQFFDLKETDLEQLAGMLKRIVPKLREATRSYNVLVVSAPRGKDLHLYVRVIPRSFHFGPMQTMGLYFSPVFAEQAAQYYRGEIPVEKVNKVEGGVSRN